MGAGVYNLCKQKEMTPNGVAKELGIPSGTITWWKKGKTPHYDKLEKLSNYFNVSTDYLLGYEAQKENAPGEMILTESENMLLELFRSLPPDKQELVAQTVKAFADSQK